MKNKKNKTFKDELNKLVGAYIDKFIESTIKSNKPYKAVDYNEYLQEVKKDMDEVLSMHELKVHGVIEAYEPKEFLKLLNKWIRLSKKREKKSK